MFNIPKIIFFLTLLVMFTGCSKQAQVQGAYYSLDECKQELLEAEDYSPKESVDHIVIVKNERKMYLYHKGVVQSVIPVSLGKDPVGTKIQQGDNKTPEGQFWISRKLCSPKYYRSLCISYPRPTDVTLAHNRGVNPGGNITIHAQPAWNASGKQNDYMLARNWTQGCVAVTNEVMKELWYAVREGVPITIKG